MSRGKIFDEELLLHQVNEKVVRCKLCPRLIRYIGEIGKNKAKKFNNQDYWAKPLPTFGDPKAKLLVIGLALLLMVEIELVEYLQVTVLVIGL